ncbi:MAG: cation:proton antiporter [Chloroflexota bacterium]|nr:cation:proton antiporter [Chloroflexota bacterium]
MHALNIAIAAIAALALVMSLFTYWIRRHWINEPVLALLMGVLIGPVGLGWLDLARYGDEREIIEVTARLTLAVVLVSVGIELRTYLPRYWQSLTVLVVGGLVLMWGASALLVGWILDLALLPALLLGAVLAPIDPILTASAATGRIARENLRESTRRLLSAESSARHGIGLVFVLLPALLFTEGRAAAWGQWLTEVVLWKGLVAIAIGVAVGYVAGRAQRWSAARGFVEAETGPLVALFLALSLALVSLVELMHSDGVLAVLVAGIAFVWARADGEPGAQLEQQDRHYEQLIKQVLQVPVFLLLGAALPWAEWAKLGWAALVLVVAVLVLRRIPAMLLLKPLVRQLHRWDEALYIGWFGPVRVGALYFAAVAEKETGLAEIWTVTTLLVATSAVVHDITVTPLNRWLGGRHKIVYAEHPDV